MKHTSSIFIVTAAMLMIQGCGGKVLSTATFELSEEINGVSMKDTISLEASNDRLVSMTEIFVYDMTSVDEDVQDEISAVYDEIVSDYQTVDGIICNGSDSEGIYTINLYIELDSETIETLTGLELLTVSGDTQGLISYELTKESLVENGYTLLSETVDE